MRDVWLTFLRLGMTSFGGPVAHLGYFRREFVARRAWLDDATFTQLVAFCTLLPGPTSSQVGMLIGWMRGGPRAAFLAWLGFTLPSALAMALFGALLDTLETRAGTAPPAWLGGAIAGLTAAAGAVVAQAVLALARTQCTDRETRTIAIGALILSLALAPAANFQWVPIVVGAAVGLLFLERRAERRDDAGAPPLPIVVSPAVAVGALVAFAALVVVAAASAPRSDAAAFVATLVRAGSLVFGGGHVVLPLLQSVAENGLISDRNFFAGYGAAQALPGPLFTFATFLGEANFSPLHGAAGAAVATVVIFAPSFLLVIALLPVWTALARRRAMGRLLRGASASVVGLLAAVLYSPILTTLETSLSRMTIALVAFALIVVWEAPPWSVVAIAAVAGGLAAAAGATI